MPDGPRKQRTKARNLLNHQSQRQTQGFGRKVSQQELPYRGVFLSGLKWFICHSGLGTLLLRNLGGQGKYPTSPAWTSHEIYFCVANEGTNPPATNKTSDRVHTAPQKAHLSCRTEASWRQRLCVGQSRVLGRQNSVLERQPHRPVAHSHHRPRKHTNPWLLVESSERGSGKEERRKQNLLELPGVHSLELHVQTPASGFPGAFCTEGPF